MSVTAKVGQVITFTAAAVDAAGQEDPLASFTWAETDADGNPVSSGLISSLVASSGSGSQAACTCGNPGSTFVAVSVADPDGNVIQSVPFAVTVQPSTDAVSVTISATVSTPGSSVPGSSAPPASSAPVDSSSSAPESSSAPASSSVSASS